jgi:predicted aspartyl protease
MVVDTGSTGSILPISLVRQHFGSTPLEATTQTALSYGKRSIRVLGVLRARARYKSSETEATFLVVDLKDSPLLGLDLFHALGMNVADTDSHSRCKTEAETPPLQPIQPPGEAWSKLSLSITGPHAKVPSDQRYLLILQDYASKWPEVATCGKPTAAACIQFLQKVFSRNGYPRELVTNKSPRYTTKQFQRYLAAHGVMHCRIAAYTPTANSMAQMIIGFPKQNFYRNHRDRTSWTEVTRDILVHYRRNLHPSTGTSPFEALYGGRPMETKATNPIASANPRTPFLERKKGTNPFYMRTSRDGTTPGANQAGYRQNATLVEGRKGVVSHPTLVFP